MYSVCRPVMYNRTQHAPHSRARRMYLYVLVNPQGKTYVGVSRHPLRRLVTHNSKAKSLARHYTNRNRPWKMVAVVQGFTTRKQALRAEYVIKHRPVVRTCGRLLRTDDVFRRVDRVQVVIRDMQVCAAVVERVGDVENTCICWED